MHVHTGDTGRCRARRTLCSLLTTAACTDTQARALWTALLGVVAAAVSVTPLVLFQAAAYEAFCRRDAHGAAHVSSAAPAGAYDAGVGSSSSSSTGSTGGGGGGSTGPYDWPRPWCSSRVPYVYGFVQLLYWNVGFLRYWTLQQVGAGGQGASAHVNCLFVSARHPDDVYHSV
mgnify:CR=1 FL=1